MKGLCRLFSQILLLFVFISSIQTTHAAVNYKLTSIINDFAGNLSMWVGKRQASIDCYVDWCNNSIGWFFPLDMDRAWNRSIVPLITWKIADCNHGDGGDPGITKKINNNMYDPYINQFADRLKKWLAGSDGIYGTDDDRRAFMRLGILSLDFAREFSQKIIGVSNRIFLYLGHEMNGNWYSWSTGSTPNDYVLAWRHTYNILSSKGLDPTRVQWVWSVNAQDVGQYTAEEYWVGDNYTHWLGIDGYNWGSSQSWSKWQWPNEVLDNMMGRLRKLSSTKPMSLNEYGTVGVRTGNTTDVQSKNEWLRQVCDYINNNNIKMASYFNVDEPNQDIMIFGGTHGDVVWNNFNAYSAYRDCLQSNDWIEPDITNPRLITDDQFAGRF